MSQNVIFKIGTSSQYSALATKNENTLYWLSDTQELYKGEVLFGKGAFASETASGLLSAEDYKQLKALITSAGSCSLSPVDGSIVIKDNKIGVGLSAVEGNILKLETDGLFASVDLTQIEGSLANVDERLTAVDGKLITVETNLGLVKQDIVDIKESIVGGIRYKGPVATRNDLPTDAQVGDLYEITDEGAEVCWNGEGWFDYGTSHFVPVAGAGIVVNGAEIGVKIASESHGLTIVDGGSLSMLLATAKQDGAMSKEDKAKLDAIPEVYVAKKYEITDAPAGTLVNYGEKEIRIMCPNGAEYNLQSVGAGGNPNTYYVTFRTYAPSADAVGYIEHLGDKSDVEILKDIKTDKYGRRYQTTWLGIATFDETTGVWNYYGKNSSTDKFIGWDYQIDWYDANDVMIASDRIRINLSNEGCHHTIVPSYMADYVESSEVEDLKATIAAMEESYSWGEI
jgi:hypothetical protein